MTHFPLYEQLITKYRYYKWLTMWYFSLISDFVLSFLVSDIAVIMYQAVLTKNFSTNLSDSTIVSAILYLILHVLMVFTRIVIFNAYGKRFKFSKLFILICSFIPAIGYAAISIQKN